MKARVITVKQAAALRYLYLNECVSASDFDRHVLESLVERGYAIKHNVGYAVTYSISASGRAVYKSL